MKIRSLVFILLLLTACAPVQAAPPQGVTPEPDVPVQTEPPGTPWVPAECDARNVSLSASALPDGYIQIRAEGLQPGEAVRLAYFLSSGERMYASRPGKVANTNGVFDWIADLEPGHWLIQLTSQDGVACTTITVK